MSRSLKVTAAAAALALGAFVSVGAVLSQDSKSSSAPAKPAAKAPAKKLALGRAALPAEVKAWDIDVRPDGLGLPVGKGSVKQGEKIFVEQCAACHGEFGEGKDRWPVLAGGQGSLKSEGPEKTIGSYWPYLSTVYDYINRSMPFGNAQSLTPDQVYAITAYLLNMNDVVKEDFVLSDKTFKSVKLPNVANFYDDDRTTTEKSFWKKNPCMSNCKTSVKITKHATVIDVTPEANKNNKKGPGSGAKVD